MRPRWRSWRAIAAGRRWRGRSCSRPCSTRAWPRHRCGRSGPVPVGCRWADGWADYLGTPEKAEHPYAAPLQASRLAGLPPALLVSAGDDPLRDEAATYARRLAEAGVTVRHHVEAGPSHWPKAYGDAPRPDACLCRVGGEIAAFYALTAPP